MTTVGRTEASTRTRRQKGAPMIASALHAGRTAAIAAKGTGMRGIAGVIVASLFLLASHAFANDPYGAASPEPVAVRVEIVVYPFAPLQDASTAGRVVWVDPYGWNELGSTDVPSFEDLPYPMAGLVTRSGRDAPEQVDPYAAATAGSSEPPRVEIVVYPFAPLQDASTAGRVVWVDPYGWNELGSTDVPSVDELPYPMAGMVSGSRAVASEQVDPYAAATEQPEVPRVVIFVYPFHGEGPPGD